MLPAPCYRRHVTGAESKVKYLNSGGYGLQVTPVGKQMAKKGQRKGKIVMADHRPSEMLRKDSESEISDQAIDLLRELYPNEMPPCDNKSGVTVGESSVVFADTYRRTRSVSKKAKIKLLHIYYPKQPPTWLDEVPIIIEDNSVWVFRPTHFMDDIADSWLGGKVVLSESEKQEMEKLSWFEKWLSNIANRRKRKRCNMSNDDI